MSSRCAVYNRNQVEIRLDFWYKQQNGMTSFKTINASQAHIINQFKNKKRKSLKCKLCLDGFRHIPVFTKHTIRPYNVTRTQDALSIKSLPRTFPPVEISTTCVRQRSINKIASNTAGYRTDPLHIFYEKILFPSQYFNSYA